MGFLLLLFLVFFAPLILFVGQYCAASVLSSDRITNTEQHGLQLHPVWGIASVLYGQDWTDMEQATSAQWPTRVQLCPSRSRWTIC